MPPCPRTRACLRTQGTGTVSPNDRTSGSEGPIKRTWVSDGSSGALINRRAVRGRASCSTAASHGECKVPVLSKPRARAWECIPTTLSIGAGLWRSQMDALGRRAQARASRRIHHRPTIRRSPSGGLSSDRAGEQSSIGPASRRSRPSSCDRTTVSNRSSCEMQQRTSLPR
jgi:hypothetical protein